MVELSYDKTDKITTKYLLTESFFFTLQAETGQMISISPFI